MGALTGTITASSYRIDGELDPGFRDSFLKKLERHGFKDIEVSSEQEESMGWVTLQDPFSTTFELPDVFWNDYALFAMRQDTLRIPARTLKLHYKKALADYLVKTGKERANPSEQEEVKDHLTKTLRRRLLPNTRVIEVIWSLSRGEVWLFSSSNKMKTLFQERFHATFGMEPIPRNAYALLENMDLSKEALRDACELEPTAFAAPPNS